MKVLSIVMAIILLLTPVSAWAATDTASATVSVTIPLVCTLELTRDVFCVTRGSATTIIFDKRDAEERPGGEQDYMYAPYRGSEDGKNWHVASIDANGSTVSLSTSVSGTIGTTPLADILQLLCGGFYAVGEPGTIPGTHSTDWENVNGWNRTLSRTFRGSVPFKYRLKISGMAAGGPYSGTLTFTLTST